MARILMVSKPVAPPWNDSSKNLVRALAAHVRRHAVTVMSHAGVELAIDGVAVEAVYAPARARFAPALWANARVLARLLLGPRHDLWHFFFAPNPRSSAAGAWASRVRRVPSVQTVCSAPAPGADLRALLFADRNVVLSRHSEQVALAAGVPAAKLRRIAPAVAPLTPLTREQAVRARAELGVPVDAHFVLYPGDLEFSRGAERMLRVHAQLAAAESRVLGLACRPKTAAAYAEESRLHALAERLGVAARVRWFGETARIHELLAVADVVALPSETLYAKMDLPLVLIEAMLLARAVVVAAQTPAAELADDDAARACSTDLDALAAQLGSLLDDERARYALGDRARAAALTRFDPVRVAAEYEALYDELLS